MVSSSGRHSGGMTNVGGNPAAQAFLIEAMLSCDACQGFLQPLRRRLRHAGADSGVFVEECRDLRWLSIRRRSRAASVSVIYRPVNLERIGSLHGD
jgi:hypothetical protein